MEYNKEMEQRARKFIDGKYTAFRGKYDGSYQFRRDELLEGLIDFAEGEITEYLSEKNEAMNLNGCEFREVEQFTEIAQKFHDTYERLAPQFGYVTRTDTRKFDPHSPNGKLMIATVCEVAEYLSAKDESLSEYHLCEECQHACPCGGKNAMTCELCPTCREDKGREIDELKRISRVKGIMVRKALSWRQRCEELEAVAAALYLGHDDAKEQMDMYKAVYLGGTEK